MNQVTQRTHVSKSSLLKFEIPNIFPDFDRILYLDSDIIFTNDISSVFSLDISDNYIAAVTEFWGYYDKMRYYFGVFGKVKRAFNAGFILYNIQKIRKDNITEQLWKEKYSSKSFLMDQTCLNNVIGQNFYNLPVRYNFNPMFLGEFNVRNINKVYNTSYISMKEIIADLSVVHYVCGSAKPWLFEGVSLSRFWFNEYNLLPGDKPDLSLKRAPKRIQPEFCKIYKDLRQGSFRLLKLVSYGTFILFHWNYFRKLLYNPKALEDIYMDSRN